MLRWRHDGREINHLCSKDKPVNSSSYIILRELVRTAFCLVAWIFESILSQKWQLEQCDDYEEPERIARFYCRIDGRWGGPPLPLGGSRQSPSYHGEEHEISKISFKGAREHGGNNRSGRSATLW